MKVFGANIFGILLIIAGGVFLLNNIFNINVSVIRVLIGAALCLIGLSIMFNGFSFTGDDSNIVFDDRSIQVKENKNEYTVIFSKGTIDITNAYLDNRVRNLKINVIFGHGRVILTPEIPTVIKASSAFGTVTLPDNSAVTFSTKNYNTANIDKSKGYLEVEANAVFGVMNIVYSGKNKQNTMK